MLMPIYDWSCNDIGFALSRLSRYIQAPNRAAFKGLVRVIWYLATHPNQPVMYPCQSIAGIHTLCVDFDCPKFECIEIPNGLIFVVDSNNPATYILYG